MITIDGLSKRFGAAKALEAVDLEVVQGGSLALLGPSGSGKSTLLALVAGLIDADAGSIEIGSRVVSAPHVLVAPHRRGVGMVFQGPALWPHLTVRANVAFGLGRMAPAQARTRLDAILERTSTAHLADRPACDLSGGEARRVALARALAPQPSVVLLDEPLAGVDPIQKPGLLDLIAGSLRELGATAVYVTQDPAEARRVATHVAFLEQGRLVAGGTWDVVAASPRTDIVMRYLELAHAA